MKKKVLLLVVPALWLGGQERVAVNTAAILREEYDVHLAVFDTAGGVYEAPCDLINLDVPAAQGRLRKLLNVLRRSFRLSRIKRKLNTDFCYSFGTSANFVTILAGGPGKRVLSVRGFATVGMPKFVEKLHKRADRILCVSKVMAEALAQSSPSLKGKIECLYNPYDVDSISQMGAEAVEDYDFRGRVIISHGRLEEVKNYPRLIKAYSLVRQSHPDTRLLIIGEGSERGRLEKLIEELGLQECADILGFRSNPFSYLAKSSLYVLSSYSEGFPNSLIEGMAFLPAVAVDCKSGPREILSDGAYDRECTGVEEADYGILVKQASRREFSTQITEDDRCLAAAICRMLEDPIGYDTYKAKARERVLQYSFSAYRRKLKKILEEN